MRWINEFVGIKVNSEHVMVQGPFQHDGLKDINVYIAGDVYGAYIDGCVWDPQKLIQQLAENAKEESILEKILRRAVGDFFVIISGREKTMVFTAPGGHGIFYTLCGGKYIFSDIPDNILPLIKSHAVSDHEVLQWVVLGGERPIPFHYIFEEVKCLMGGSRLSILKDGSAHIDVYIFPPAEPNCTYETYADGLEGTAKVIVAECARRKKPIYALFSGGIDSSTTTLSIMSAGGKVTPITLMPARYRDLEGYEVTYALATLSAEAIGLPLMIIPFDEFDEKVIDKQFDTFGSSLYGGTYLATAFFSNPDLFGSSNPLVFSADGMDTIYAIAHQKPPFKMPFTFKNSRLAVNPGYFLSMQYTKQFHSAVLQSTPFWRRVYPALSGRVYREDIKLPLNAYDYLVNMIISTKLLTLHSDKLLSVVLSSKGRGLRTDDMNIFLKTAAGKKFIEYKVQTVIKHMLGDVSLPDLDKNNLSLLQLNSIMRRLAYSTFFWEGLAGSYFSAQKFHYSYLAFPMQGPLTDAFSGFYAGLKEAVFPKWFEYRYFRERTKKRYFFTATDSLPVERNQRRHLPMVNHLDLFMKSMPYTERMLRFIDPEKSALLDLLKDNSIRNFVRQAYADVRENARSNASLWPMLSRLYQLESHVRSVTNGANKI